MNIIDRRRGERNKNAVNRARFIERLKPSIKEAVERSVGDVSIEEIGSQRKVNIPIKDLSEPYFRHGNGGKKEVAHPGNREFSKGDMVERPKASEGNKSGASKDGEGFDDFYFTLTKEEYLDIFFEDLKLPDFLKKHLFGSDQEKFVRAGQTSHSTPNNLDVLRTLKRSKARRLALNVPKQSEIEKAEKELAELLKTRDSFDQEVKDLLEKIEKMKKRKASFPFIDPFDLSFRHNIKQTLPISKAVMFCLMDVSGSMEEEQKIMAKKFFALLNFFLKKNYEKCELVFIRYHTYAKEVDEEEFFTSRETGGTVVSTSLRLMLDILEKRYDQNEWNIYGAKVSDGDNWKDDCSYSAYLLEEILGIAQHFFYIEINDKDGKGDLWQEYVKLRREYSKKISMQIVRKASDIHRVFKKIFSKKETRK